MKKSFTLLFAAILFGGTLSSHAATFIVDVGHLQFTPADFTINAGDTIIWTWTEGSHTTTSTQIPPGAIGWDEDIKDNSPVFMYSPLVAGSYNYVCSPHASMGMTGHFTVNNTSGLSDNHLDGATFNGSLISNDALLVRFNLLSPTEVSLRLFDMIGNSVSTLLVAARKPAGSFEEKFLLPYLKTGVYILQLQTPEGVLAKRIFVP